MTSHRKAVFFDIDGTIWNTRNEIVPSTIQAIHALQKDGHLAFLNSGRCRSYIQNPQLLSIGFDGLISGCGTMIEYGGKVLFYHRIEADLLERTVRTVRRYGFRPILEGREYLYLDEAEFGQDPYGRKLIAEMRANLRSIEDNWGVWEASKLACATENADRETCFRELSSDYDYMIHNEAVVEMVPKGYHKGTGLLRICDLLDIDPADTFAFGDGANDLGMIRDAGVGIAMGNGADCIKRAADYITSPMEQNGIWNACQHFGLVSKSCV